MQPAWSGAATWQGEACAGSNTSAWSRVLCQGGRVTAVSFNGLSASGPLEGFGRLTALTDLRLAYNRFSGARGRGSGRPQLHLSRGLLCPQHGSAMQAFIEKAV